jgi:uncharacterized protein (TIGR00297 family)
VGHRKLNFILIFITIALFVLEANVDERYRLLIALFLAFGLSFILYFLNLLSIDGARAATLLGLVTYGFGGLEMALLIILFFFSSNIIGIPFGQRTTVLNSSIISSRRTGSQVWGNAFWFALCIFLWFVLKADMFIIAAFGSIATACSDTWATEVGTRFKTKAYLITNRKEVEVGTDGAVSIPGTIAAILGAALISVFALFFDKNFLILSSVAIFIGGLIGTFADSYLGALYQYGTRQLPVILDSDENRDNNSVNFISTGIGALATLILYNILIYVVV